MFQISLWDSNILNIILELFRDPFELPNNLSGFFLL